MTDTNKSEDYKELLRRIITICENRKIMPYKYLHGEISKAHYNAFYQYSIEEVADDKSQQIIARMTIDNMDGILHELAPEIRALKGS